MKENKSSPLLWNPDLNCMKGVKEDNKEGSALNVNLLTRVTSDNQTDRSSDLQKAVVLETISY